MSVQFSRLFNLSKHLMISPAVGWAIFGLLMVFGLDLMPLKAIGDLRPMFWGIAVLVIA